MSARTMTVTLSIKVRDMTEEELEAADDGLGEDGEDCAPSVSDYVARDIADLIPAHLKFDEFQDEMFAGSAVFARIEDVSLVAAQWDEAA